MRTLDEVVSRAREMRASDIHIVAGAPIKCRVDGAIITLGEAPLANADCEAYAMEAAGEKYSEIKRIGELDLALSFKCGARTRLNIFRQQGAVSLAIRILSDSIPALDSLGLPSAVMDFPNYRTGIVLVTGETGSGKSTTLAAVLDSINHSRPAHIITLEDPIEYVYTPDKCVINQREIGRDTESYAMGLRAVLREDPDVVLIGEMRDLETIATALTAAETGHLVFATLHTNSAADSIDRVIDVFPEGRQRQIRMQLSTTLRAVLSQQLIPRKSGTGRAAACETMVVNPAIANLIREGKTPQMANYITMGAQNGSITMDNALISLFRSGVISSEAAYKFARDSEYMRKQIR